MKQSLLAALLLLSVSTTLLAQPTLAWQKCLGILNENDEVPSYNILQTSDGGFIASCITTANNGDITGNHGGFDIWVVKLSSAGSVQWKKSFGGSGDDFGTIALTNDGGYMVYGSTNSNDGDASGNHGLRDFWLVKLSNTGNIQWQKCYGGSANEGGALALTNDGGYMLYGYTNSNDGDVSGNHGGSDVWLLKLDNNGVKQWQKCYGGSNGDQFYGPPEDNIFIQTTDGGYLLSASTNSNDGDVSGHHGNEDAWILKLSNNGSIQWQKCLGGSGNEYNDLGKIIATTDGGCIVGRYHVTSADGDVSGYHGSGDAWVVKLDNTGAIQWQKSLGGSEDDYFANMFLSSDGGYVVFSRTKSFDGDVSGNHGGSDIWVVKLDVNGNIQWQKCLGGSDYEEGGNKSFGQTNDDGYFVSIGISSNDGNVFGNHGEGDIWAVKLDNNGTIQWQKCLGGSQYDDGFLSETSDGGFISVGITLSNDGDVSGLNGFANIWITRLGTTSASEEIENNNDWTSFPNPTPHLLTITSDNLDGVYDVTITDALGRIVLAQSGLPIHQRLSIDLSGLTEGIYYYTLQGVDEIVRAGKVVKTGI